MLEMHVFRIEKVVCISFREIEKAIGLPYVAERQIIWQEIFRPLYLRFQ